MMKEVSTFETEAGQKQPLTVVGVGASAGGLEAFSQLLHSLPDDTGLAIVLVQHLAPKHESILPNLLGGATRLPVAQVSDGMRMEADHVYVIPPNAYMEIRDGTFRLTARPDDRQFMPADFFFRSLAEYAQNRAIGVILSGTASDGSIGLREIKAVGGITIAQEPETAKYDGMPRAAIATGVIDLVLSPQAIAAELVRINRHPYVRLFSARKPGDDTPVMDEQLYRVMVLLRGATGVDFTQYKQPTVRRRLQRRMALSKIVSMEQYVKFLQENPDEVKNLYQDILIHVTQFFREPESFEALAGKVLPKIAEARSKDGPIRVWVPGCASGEEAYSVAITLLEFFQEDGGYTPIQVFATDVSEPAIETARAGVYAENIRADVTPERLRKFFTRTDGTYRIVKMVRDLCVFARQDLAHDPPFSKLDLIVCRNVLIYLNPALQKRLITIFHYALKPGGFLMLAGAETVGPFVELFAPVDKKHKIYGKKEGAVRAELMLATLRTGYGATGAVKPAPHARGRAAIQEEANKVVLGRYAPAGVIIDDDFQIIEFRGQTGRYLEPAPGDASLNVLKMAREGLLYGLRTAAHEARKRDSAVRRDGLKVQFDGKWCDVNLNVLPLSVAGEPRHFLVLFEEPPAPPKTKEKEGKRAKARRSPKEEGSRAVRLERELAANREYLQSIIQDLEAANEELQSANEEILSSNEELQSTNEELDTAKEELQSTNEELNTLNEELHGRNEELSLANSDLLNLVGSVQIAIVIIASDMRIRRFTPMAEKVLNLISGDVGRPISHIKPNIDCPDLEQLITEVADNVSVVEREVQDRQGNWYALRIRPYKNTENRIDGAVLALFDIDAVKRTQAQLREATDYVEGVIQTLREPLVVLDREFRLQTASSAFCRMTGLSPHEVEGRHFLELANGRWNIPRLRSLLEEVIVKDGHHEGLEIEVDLPALGRRKILFNARLIKGGGGRPDLIVLAMDPAAAPS